MSKLTIVGRVNFAPKVFTNNETGRKYTYLNVSEYLYKDKNNKSVYQNYSILITGDKLIDNLVVPYFTKGTFVALECSININYGKNEQGYDDLRKVESLTIVLNNVLGYNNAQPQNNQGQNQNQGYNNQGGYNQGGYNQPPQQDPFGGANGDPFSTSQDPFNTSQDPFSGGNGGSTFNEEDLPF